MQEEELSSALHQKAADIEALEAAQRTAEENHAGAVVRMHDCGPFVPGVQMAVPCCPDPL